MSNERVQYPASNDMAWLKNNAASVLKSRQWLKDGQQHALYSANPANFALFTEVLMLLSYFESSHSLLVAESTFQQSMRLLTSQQHTDPAFEELAHQGR